MGKRDIDLIVEQALGIAEKLSKLSRARSATRKAPDPTETEIVLLNVLAKRSGRSVSIQEVLKETGFSPSRLSKAIKELELRKRLIRSQRVEGDRRRVELMMQGQGLKTLVEFRRLRKKRLQLVFQQLSQQDFKMVSEPWRFSARLSIRRCCAGVIRDSFRSGPTCQQGDTTKTSLVNLSRPFEPRLVMPHRRPARCIPARLCSARSRAETVQRRRGMQGYICS